MLDEVMSVDALLRVLDRKVKMKNNIIYNRYTFYVNKKKKFCLCFNGHVFK